MAPSSNVTLFQRSIAFQTYTVTCPCPICSNGPLPFKLTLWPVHVQYVPTVHCRSSLHGDLSMSNMFQRSIAFQTYTVTCPCTICYNGPLPFKLTLWPVHVQYVPTVHCLSSLHCDLSMFNMFQRCIAVQAYTVTCPCSICSNGPLPFTLTLWPVHVQYVPTVHCRSNLHCDLSMSNMFQRSIAVHAYTVTYPCPMCFNGPLPFTLTLWPVHVQYVPTIHCRSRLHCDLSISNMFQRSIAVHAYTVTCPCSICSNDPLPFKLTPWPGHVQYVSTVHCRSSLHCDVSMFNMFQRSIAVQAYTVTCPCSICSNCPLPFKLTLWHVHVQYVPTVHCRSRLHSDLSMSNMFQRSIAVQAYTVTCPCSICSNGPLPFKLTLWHVHVQYVPTVHCRSSLHSDLSMSNMFQRSIAFQAYTVTCPCSICFNCPLPFKLTLWPVHVQYVSTVRCRSSLHCDLSMSNMFQQLYYYYYKTHPE